MNTYRFLSLPAFSLVCLFLVPTYTEGGILDGMAKILNDEFKNADKRSKICSAPMHKNAPVLGALHKRISDLFGVKNGYKQIVDLPSTVANQFPEIGILREAVKIAIKVPLSNYVIKPWSRQEIMRSGVKAMIGKLTGEVEQKKAVNIKVDEPVKTPISIAIIKDVGMDIAMGDRPSIAGLVFDHVAKDFLKGKKYSELSISYLKAITCKISDYYIEEPIAKQIREKIKHAAEKN